jgi:hypothetical protein
VVDLPIVAMIEEAIDISGTKITWKEIANAAGITNSALSHFKSGTELKFPHLLKIAKFIFEGNYMAKFKEWCLNLNQPANIRYALEYLAVNRQIEELEELIVKVNNKYSSKDLTDWAKGYSILALYLKGNEPCTVLNQLRLYTPKTCEMKVLALITEIWCRNKMREYSTMNSLVSGLDLTINEIKDDFIKESYGLRVKEVLAFVNLYKLNNKEIARKYAEEIISKNFSPTFTANASYLLGMSYLFDNYDKCLGNIMKHRELLIESERIAEIEIIDNNDLPFINNIWKKHNKQPETNDISEKAHYEALNGDKKLALELIDDAIEKEGLSGFKLYYKALATDDKSLFMQSLIFFINRKGDKFYAGLPYERLKNDPIYKPMADLLFMD